jgi:hypothetical protein
MADSSYEIVELRFDVRHPELTDVYAYIEAHGDAPHMVQGWHFKTYPHTLSTAAIHAKLGTDHENSPVMWPRRAPPDVFKTEAGELARAVINLRSPPEMHPLWPHIEALKMMAERVIGEREGVRPGLPVDPMEYLRK